MKKQLTLLIVIASASIFLAGCNSVVKEDNQIEPEQSQLIINLTSDATVSAHGSLMGIHLAENALDSGLEVMVFLNVNGVKLLQDGSDTLSFHGENILEALNKVAEKGGEIRICPHCAEVIGIDKSDIPENFKMHDRKKMMDMLRENPTVFTY